MNTRLSAVLSICGVLLLPIGTRANSNPGCQTEAPVELTATGSLIQNGAITKLDLSWFGLEGSSAGPAFFTLLMRNSDSVDQTVRVLVEMKAQPSDPAIADMCTSPCWLQREVTVPIVVPAHGAVVRSSRDLFQTEFMSGGIEAATSPFKSLVGRLGFIPSSYLNLSFQLLCENPGTPAFQLASGSDVGDWAIGPKSVIESPAPLGPEGSHSPYYQTVRVPQLLSPGVSPEDGFREIPTTTPTFVFQSELSNPILVYPPDEPKFTVELWKVSGDETPAEAVLRRPLGTATENVGIVGFPLDWPTLEPGENYAWRVTAHLRGPIQEPLYSDLHTFSVSRRLSGAASPVGFQRLDQIALENQDQIDRRINAALSSLGTGRVLSPEERRLFRALFAILGDDPRLEELMARDIVDLEHLRVDGRPTSLESIESLAMDIQAARRALNLVEFP